MMKATPSAYFTSLLLLLSINIAMAQQNLFNVPSSQITPRSKPFFQQQINLLIDGTMMFNTTFCYGLGKEFEVGVNMLGLVIDPASSGSIIHTNSDASNPPVYPFFTVNLQKGFTLSRTFTVGLGTQLGYSSGFHFGNFIYGNLVTHVPRYRLKLITGVNHGSESFLGPGDLNPVFSSPYDPIGYQFGLEQEMIKDKLLLITEHISGTHTLGVSVLGIGYYVAKHWVLSAGYQFSSAGNETPNSLVFEITFVPSIVKLGDE